jgi:hypothetical protein
MPIEVGIESPLGQKPTRTLQRSSLNENFRACRCQTGFRSQKSGLGIDDI